MLISVLLFQFMMQLLNKDIGKLSLHERLNAYITQFSFNHNEILLESSPRRGLCGV